MIRTSGWNTLSRDIEKEVTGIFRGAALVMYDSLADRDGSGPDGGSPLASGHYSASFRVGLNGVDATTAREPTEYDYPPPEIHKYNAWNLPSPVIRPTPRSVVKTWLRPFKLGDTIHISNSTAYAVVIESGRRGKRGSWQRPHGVILPTLDKLFQQNGWY